MSKKFLIILLYAAIGIGGFCFTTQVQAANCGDTDNNGATDATCACGDTVIGAADYTYQLPGNLTCTGDGLIIGDDSITIDGDDGAGGKYIIDGDDGATDYGIDNSGGWDDISIKNLNITDFGRGIYFTGSVGDEGQVIQNNNVNSCSIYGISLTSSSSNTLTSNTVNSNGVHGIYLTSSSSNTLTSNTTNSNPSTGISLTSSSSNTLTSNTANSNYFGISLTSSSSNTLTGNTTNSNVYSGIYLTYSSSSNTLTSNTANSNPDYGIYFDSSSSSNTLTSNTANSSAIGVYIESSSNTLSDNIMFNNRYNFYNTGTANTYSSNQFKHNFFNGTFTFVEPTRTYNVGNTISFDVSMFDPEGTACSGCSYTITSSPSETITSSKNSNQITGSFTATKSGTYSLLFTITDTDSNTTKRNLSFSLGDTEAKTTKYYLRAITPTHGQPGFAYDSRSLLFTAPTSTEEWWCDGWVQNSPDELPDYPLSNLSDIVIYSWYKQTAGSGAYIGVQRRLSYDTSVDYYNSSVPAAAEYTESTKSFDLSALGGDWIMDYQRSWYWLAVKLKGGFPYWTTFPSGHTADEASYSNFTYSYTTTPAVKSISNDDVNVLSATAPTTDTSDATIVLDYPLTGSASANIVLGDPGNSHAFRRPFQGYTTTINSDGTATLQATGITSTATTIESVPMDITPNAGTIDVSITTWNTSGDYSKEWTETGTGAASAIHTIGDLANSAHYVVAVDSSSSGITGDDCTSGVCLSNSSGQITFTYIGGYSEHTFTVSQSAVAPTPTNFTASVSSLTSVSLSVDTFTNDTLGSAGYYFYLAGDETNHNSGWIQTNTWQDTNSDPHFFCNARSYYLKYRNRDAIETELVSAAARTICGGGPQITSFTTQPARENPTSAQNETQGGAIKEDNKTEGQNQTKDLTKEQIAKKIQEIRQQIILLLQQVIQMLLEKIAQMR